MKLAFILLAVAVASIQANTVFLNKEEASQVLNRNKRANFAFEEIQEGDLQRECYDEQCNYEEAHEVFEDTPATEEFWKGLMYQCDKNPCQEPGMTSCVNIYNGYVCLCKPGYTGRHCETEINHCKDHPCGQNGVCMNDGNTYACSCRTGFEGRDCDEDINECQNDDLCKNGAECQNLMGSFKCHCKHGWTGTTCAQDVDECERDPCMNRGTCVNERGSFRCICRGGYSGTLCNTNVNECGFGHCPEGSTCVDQPNAFTCQCPEDGCKMKEGAVPVPEAKKSKGKKSRTIKGSIKENS